MDDETHKPSASEPETMHASAARASRADLLPLAESLVASPVLGALLNTYPEGAILLDHNRQIVACNRRLLELVGATRYTDVIGRRLGEILGCIHMAEMAAGCGTAESCRTCGAVNTVLRCQQTGQSARDECRILACSCRGTEALDLEIVASSVSIEDADLVVVAVRNIADAKRREALERIFFHDTLNVAGGIQGLAALLQHDKNADRRKHLTRLQALSYQLIEQIRAQRDLALAEQGELAPTWSTILVEDLFDDLKAAYLSHPAARGRTISFLAEGGAGATLQSDRVLLNRVLGNLIKNALEACRAGEEVAVTCTLTAESACFAVHNPTVMPRDVQLQVFQRSFTTKTGLGRGLGTFSVKLLTTRYLGGEVVFESEDGKGTTFTATVPRTQPGLLVDETPEETAVFRGTELAGQRILLAEDNPDNQLLVDHMLTQAGADVTTVGDGRQAVEAAMMATDAGAMFDIILMDMDMPVLDGYEATRILRASGYTGRIVAFTAHEAASDKAACLDAGCDEHVSKPLSRAKLFEAILSTALAL